ELYARLAARGHQYGPAFRAVRAVWRVPLVPDDFYAEVELDESAHGDAATFGIHPALLDAALHATTLFAADTGSALLPFVWSDVTLTASGATALRVRLTRSGRDSIALTATRSEEHTSELQSRENLVCRLLLEKKTSLTYRL